tara:strand:+ start:251 stop:520 length:270 start_codon:yes stop_codon:yes gene_type:complete
MFDEEQRDKKHNDARELELLTIRNIMKSENGRAFMYSCLQNCCTFESIFNTDAHQHAFNSGARSHGLWLDAELREAATDDYYKMLKENR